MEVKKGWRECRKEVKERMLKIGEPENEIFNYEFAKLLSSLSDEEFLNLAKMISEGKDNEVSQFLSERYDTLFSTSIQ